MSNGCPISKSWTSNRCEASSPNFLRSKRRSGIQRAPRGLRNGDAPVRRAHQGPGEDEAVSGGLPHSPDHSAARVVVREGLWVIEGVNDYGGGRVFSVVVIFELADGKIWRDTRYYAEPFEAPEWRAQLVERILERALQVFLREPNRSLEGFSASMVRPNRGTLHALAYFLCTVRGTSVVMCT